MHYVEYPTTLQIEISSNCNLSCTGCCRVDESSYDIKPNKFIPKNKFLSVETFDELVNDPALSKLNKIEFCGTIDDPLTHPNFLDFLKILKEKNISSQIHTNASLRTPDYWKKIADLTKHDGHTCVKFSIDGLEDTNHLYRRGASWDKIMENAKAFIEAGGNAWWQMIVFPWNDHQVTKAKNLAKKMGFKMFKYRHDRSRSPNAIQAKEMSDKKFNTKKTKTYEQRVKSMQTMLPLKIECFSQKENYYFIGHNGQVWPCCFLMNANWSTLTLSKEYNNRFEGNYGKHWNNINYKSFSEILKSPFYTEDLVDSWKSKKHGSGCKDRVIRCTETCSVKRLKDNPIADVSHKNHIL